MFLFDAFVLRNLNTRKHIFKKLVNSVLLLKHLFAQNQNYILTTASCSFLFILISSECDELQLHDFTDPKLTACTANSLNVK